MERFACMRMPMLLLGMVLLGLMTACNNPATPPTLGATDTTNVLPPATGTSLVIVNATDSATTVIITLADSGGACASPITAEMLVKWGLFSATVDSGALWPYAAGAIQVLGPGDSIVVPGYDSLCLSGNVGFDVLPTCPCVNFPNGTTIGEFTLNPSNQSEVIDLSLVNGNNYVIKMETSGAGAWLVETTNAPLDSIRNLPFNQNNANIPGIYPPNCTVCTGTNAEPACTTLDSVCSDSAVCQLQRNTGVGGTIRISLLSRPAQGTNASLPACPTF